MLKAPNLGGARVMLQGSGPGFLNLPVFDVETGGGAGGGSTSLGGAQSPGGDGNGTGGGGDTFMAGLSDEHRAIAAENGWKDAASLFDGVKGLKATAASALTLPGDDATPEQRSEFFEKVAPSLVPKDGYTFKMPENLPKDFPYDQNFATEAQGWFKEAGLPPKAAQALHDKWVGKMADVFDQNTKAAEETALKQAEATGNAHRELVKEFGEPSSDGYKNVIAKADRAMKGLNDAGIDVSSWLAEKGVLTKADESGNQQVTDPVGVKLLAFIHDKAFTEDGLNNLNGDLNGGANPFDKDKPDLKAQSEMLGSNPERARQLIVAAGRDPKLFHL